MSEGHQREEFLSNKNIILSSPGVLLSDNYYDMYSHTASMIETTWGTGKMIQSLPSLGLGTTSSIYIANGSFLSEVYLHAVLPQINTNVTVERGWLYSCIESIQWLLGASNTSVTSISGEALFVQAMSQPMSEEKRSEMFRLAGEEQLFPPIPLPGQDVPKIEGTIVIPLPFSSLCEKKGIDTRMLTSNIVLTIKFKQPNSIFGGSGVYPTAFQSCSVLYRQGDLSNTNQSLSVPMKMDPALMYSYPFIHAQPIQAAPFRGVRASAGGDGAIVNLTGFINSDLIGIAFYVVRTDSVTPATGNSPSTFNCEEISNIVIRYNGNIIYSAPDKTYKLINMEGDQEASFFQNSIIQPGTVAPFNSVPVDSYICWVNFSKAREACVGNGEHFANTFRVSNQTFYITLNTPNDSSVQYEMRGCYFYNGIVSFKNGLTSIFYD